VLLCITAFGFLAQISRVPAVPASDRTALAGPSPVVFPLATSADRRYFQDQNGQPFPILGRAAWFITSLSVTDFEFFIDDTVNKGFNAIEFPVINHDPNGNNAPFAGNGALPFTKQLNGLPWAGSLTYGNINNEAPDFTQTNEAFWTQVDALLAYADSKGVLCFMFPAYAGYQGGAEGWMAEVTANGATKMSTYGAFVANRYKARGNIVWMLGGDYATFNAPQLAAEQGLLSGLKSVSGQQSTNFSAEWTTGSIYTDISDPTLKAAGTLQGGYDYSGNVNTQCRRGYGYATVMPTFLLEEPYDEEGPDGNNSNPNATQPVRRFQWWGVLSSTGGYVAGNAYIWAFIPGVWTNHLNTHGAQDMGRLNAFVRSIAWQSLVPSGLGGMKTLITSGGSTPSATDYVAAAANPAGTLLVAYVPPDHTGTINVDMTAMSGPAQARWFNPATAAYSLISSSIANTGTHTFTPPADNGSGYDDWVLVLDMATANPTPTPTPTRTPTRTPTPTPTPSVTPVLARFFLLTPCRLVDTRRSPGPLDGPALEANQPRTFAVANVCNVPSTARAISVNVTVAGPSTAGYYLLHAADIPPPVASTLSFGANQTRANNGMLALSGDGLGRFTVQPDLTSGTAHLVVDVNGYFQ
jgi:hypothetical protein